MQHQPIARLDTSHTWEEEAAFRGCGSGCYWRGERLVREARDSRSHGARMRKLNEAMGLFARERELAGSRTIP